MAHGSDVNHHMFCKVSWNMTIYIYFFTLSMATVLFYLHYNGTVESLSLKSNAPPKLYYNSYFACPKSLLECLHLRLGFHS